MKLSDLQNKDVVNLYNGKKVGNIVDVNIDEGSGKIVSFAIEQNKKMLSMLRHEGTSEIQWNSIEKIGEDVILIKLNI